MDHRFFKHPSIRFFASPAQILEQLPAEAGAGRARPHFTLGTRKTDRRMFERLERIKKTSTDDLSVRNDESSLLIG